MDDVAIPLAGTARIITVICSLSTPATTRWWDPTRFADLHFRLAQCYWTSGQFDKAHEHFIQARDLDALRFREDRRGISQTGKVSRGAEVLPECA